MMAYAELESGQRFPMQLHKYPMSLDLLSSGKGQVSAVRPRIEEHLVTKKTCALKGGSSHFVVRSNLILQKRFQDAYDMLTEELDSAPSQMKFTLHNRAIAVLNLKQHNDALSDFLRIIEVTDDNEKTDSQHLDAAVAYWLLGEFNHVLIPHAPTYQVLIRTDFAHVVPTTSD